MLINTDHAKNIGRQIQHTTDGASNSNAVGGEDGIMKCAPAALEKKEVELSESLYILYYSISFYYFIV